MLVLLLLACGDLDTDTGPTPAAPGADPTADCLSRWTDGVLEIDPQGPDTQIHSEALFDGEHLWFAWNRPNQDRNFDIWATVQTCDGRTVLDPFMVSESTENELDPVMAASGERVLIAWTGSASGGLDIRYRLYDRAASPVTAATRLEASRAEEVVTGNATLPAVAALDDGFLLAGSWGHPDAPAFQAFAVAISPDGALDGEAEDIELDTNSGQTYVDLDVLDGEAHLVWQEDTTTSDDPAAWHAPLGAPATRLGTPGARPAITLTSSGPWLAWDDNQGTVYVLPPGGSSQALDLGRGIHHSPRLAASGDTVAVLVMTVDSGIYNQLQLATLDASGVTAIHALSATAAPSIYEASLVLVDDHHAVVAWQEGENPAFRAWAEWLSW